MVSPFVIKCYRKIYFSLTFYKYYNKNFNKNQKRPFDGERLRIGAGRSISGKKITRRLIGGMCDHRSFEVHFSIAVIVTALSLGAKKTTSASQSKQGWSSVFVIRLHLHRCKASPKFWNLLQHSCHLLLRRQWFLLQRQAYQIRQSQDTLRGTTS